MHPAEIPPFALPATWAWSQLAEIGVLNPRNISEDVVESSFIPMPMIPVEYGIAATHEVRVWGEIKKQYTHFAECDVGLAKITPCFENGKSTVFRGLTGGFGSGTTELHIVRPIFVEPTYVLMFLKSSHFIQRGILKMTGTAGQKRVPTGYFANSPFPLPPLAEQRRIVARVDELMELCDRLETTREEREATRSGLTMATLARLNNAHPDPWVFKNHAHFAIDNLPGLTARRDQIEAIRRTILSLAVRGKLVPQNPYDEPASELLKRVKADKRDRTNPKHRRQMRISRISVFEADTNAIPANWIRATFGDLTICRDGERRPVSKDDRDNRANIYDYYGASGVIDKIDDFLFDKPLLLIGEDGANLINRSSPIAFIARGKYWVNNHAHVVDGISEDFLRYLELFINATNLSHFVTGTAQPKMNQTKLNSILVDLPPMAEQRRIIAKVDELMDLCDRLEASLAAGEDIRSRLLESFLYRVLEGTEHHSEGG